MDYEALGFDKPHIVPHFEYLIPDLLPVEAARSLVVIDSPLHPLTGRPESHRSAWAKLLASQLKAAGFEVKVVQSKTTNQERRNLYFEASCILFEVGMENHRSGDAGNLPGGYSKAEDELLFLSEMFQLHPHKLICMDRKFPNFSKIYERKDCTLPDDIKAGWKAFWSHWAEAMPSALRVQRMPTLYLGDSHILSQAHPCAEVIRLDGQTLFGALKDNIIQRLVQPHHTDVRLLFGNIDVRHHILRQPEPENVITAMIVDLKTVLFSLSLEDDRRFYVHDVFPIENETRKIPKTGWYKGEPFYGTWSMRDWVRKLFNYKLREIIGGHYVIPFPERAPWVNGICELDFGVMEKPQSCHLAYPYYRYDFDTLETRY